RDRLRLVPDHAVLVARRSLPALLLEAARRQGHRQEQVRHHPGRGRARLHWHRGGRGLERRPGFYRHGGPGHLAHERVHRPRLLRRDPGGDHRRAARRSLDVDGDGIPYRTLPGTHPTKGAYFTRGTSKNAHAVYSEAGPDYVYNMQRLLKKFETAKTLVPKAVLTPSKEPARFGCIYYGSTSPAMHEALEALSQ